jgi:hypothetical protein
MLTEIVAGAGTPAGVAGASVRFVLVFESSLEGGWGNLQVAPTGIARGAAPRDSFPPLLECCNSVEYF